MNVLWYLNCRWEGRQIVCPNMPAAVEIPQASVTIVLPLRARRRGRGREGGLNGTGEGINVETLLTFASMTLTGTLLMTRRDGCISSQGLIFLSILPCTYLLLRCVWGVHGVND